MDRKGLAHRWREMLESGEYSSAAELAKAEKVNDSYLSRILRLTLIAPDIIEAILIGRQPSTLQLDDLLKPLPATWVRGRAGIIVPEGIEPPARTTSGRSGMSEKCQ
jgi:hypothetical protein